MEAVEEAPEDIAAWAGEKVGGVQEFGDRIGDAYSEGKDERRYGDDYAYGDDGGDYGGDDGGDDRGDDDW